MSDRLRALRDSLLTSPVLSYPNFQEKFYLYADASNTGLGAILAQIINGTEKTITFASLTCANTPLLKGTVLL